MYVGRTITRVEDERLLRGHGRYVDDIDIEGAVYAAFVRSVHAHALIRNISTDVAASMPGVLKILTGKDWCDDGRGHLPCIHEVSFRDGRPMAEAPRPVFAVDRARHVGDVLAVVVAEERWQAWDAAELVEIDDEPLRANADPRRAMDDGTPQIHEAIADNLAYDWEIGDELAVDRAFSRAAHVTQIELVNNRVVHLPIEPRAVIGHYDSAADRYTLWTTSQIPHLIRQFLADDSLRVAEQKLRVVAPDVGGGFGQKAVHYPEEAAVLWASKIVGRPVRWTASRSEAFLADVHGRDQLTKGQMAFDTDGRILALRVDTIGNMGAYLSAFAPAVPSVYSAPNLSQLYAVPAIYARVHGVYTNTVPTDAYRGAGQPEAAYVVERAVEQGARELGIDPTILRERNFIQSDAFPFKTATGAVYDSGNYPALMAKLKEFAGYEALRREQSHLREQGTLLGIGVAAFIESAAFGPSRFAAQSGMRIGAWDVASVRVHPSGSMTITCGSHSHGQGHATTFRQVAADKLGCAIDDIELVFGDTSRVHAGIGTFGSRSITVLGSAITLAADRVIGKGRKLAAHLLECAETDVEFLDGRYVIRGTDREIAFREIARAAYRGDALPDDFEPGLEETVYYDPPASNNSAGVHLAVVLVDKETGEVALRDYYAVDDCGRVVNPMIVEGQIHGGVAQGIGQALMEHSVYDAETGQLLSGSLMDYALPRAADLPCFDTARLETPAPNNPLGVKGVGESGTIGAPAAVANAVIDALAHLGVQTTDMPLTPFRVWQAIRAATG